MGFDSDKPDLGRGKILADAAAKAGTPAPPEAEKLQGAFKTPSLRGVALTGPYFHDGRAKTLEEAVDQMLTGGIAEPASRREAEAGEDHGPAAGGPARVPEGPDAGQQALQATDAAMTRPERALARKLVPDGTQ